MNNEHIRAGFNQMIAAAEAANDHDAVARMEIAREYLTNAAFKTGLQVEMWRITQARR